MGIILSSPIKTKDSKDGGNDILSYGQSAMQGWRTSMEDAQCSAVDFDEGLSFFGVFDGHGGSEVSAFVAEHIIDSIKKSPSFKEKKYDRTLIEAYLDLDAQLETEEGINELTSKSKLASQRLTADNVGCTAVSFIYDDSTKSIYVANAGDSRIVMCKDGKAIPLSIDHKPRVESEFKRITEAGGFIVNGRVNGNLNLCRCIGDHEYKRDAKLPPEKQIISAYPDTRVVKIEDDCEFILLGCDGVWDCLSSDNAVAFVKQKLAEYPADSNLSVICEDVLERCCARDPSEVVGCDNISFTLVVFNKNVKRGTNVPEVEEEMPQPLEQSQPDESNKASA